jgi:hypothetical protein
MANVLTVFNQEHWAPEMQKMYFKENVARALVNETLANTLTDGTRINKPYRSGLKAQDYTKGNDITTFNDLGGVNEYLDINVTKIVPFYVDDIDKIENKWDMAMIYAQDAQRVLNNLIDQKCMAEYSSAYSFVSAGDLGGSGTGSYAVGVSNIDKLFTVAGRKLDKFNRGQNSRFAVVGPHMRETLRLSVAGRETGFGDTVGDNGMIAKRFGFDIHFSNNVPFSAVLTYAAIPVAGQFIIVDGVTFNWVAKNSAASAGDIAIQDTEDEAYANLCLAIIGTATPSAGTYVDVSADDRESLYSGSLNAVQNAGGNTVTITGYGDVVVDLSTTTNLVLTSNTQYPLFGVKGASDFVVEKSPSVEFRVAEKRLGKYVYAWTRYGMKTFTKEKKGLVYGKIDVSSWV